jgi:hypothetical protein
LERQVGRKMLAVASLPLMLEVSIILAVVPVDMAITPTAAAAAVHPLSYLGTDIS